MNTKQRHGFITKDICLRALKVTFSKLFFQKQMSNKVIYLSYLSAVLATILTITALLMKANSTNFILSIMLFSWVIVIIVTFIESLVESRGKAQADMLRASQKEGNAHRIPSISQMEVRETVFFSSLKKGDIIYVASGEKIPADGEVIKGAASVDESAITGESAPVIREADSDRCIVTGGTIVISDWLVIKISNAVNESFLNKMITTIENTTSQKTKNEVIIQRGLIIFTFIIGLFSFMPMMFSNQINITNIAITLGVVIVLMPTTISILLITMRIVAMGRLNQMNVLTKNEQAIELAGQIDVLLLDKKGAVTLGNRQACEFIPLNNTSIKELADTAQLATLFDNTPEGRSVVVLAKEKFDIRGRDIQELNIENVPFDPLSKLSGVNINGQEIRKGSPEVIKKYVKNYGSHYSNECQQVVEDIANKGGTSLIIIKDFKILGVIYFKDIIKQGIHEKCSILRKMGIHTVMTTQDEPVIAAAIAAEVGVDDFLANATYERKLELINDYQAQGKLIAMNGSEAEEAPLLAKVNLGIAMNAGSQVTKEVGQMIDLDSSPIKLMDIIYTCKQLLMSHKCLTIFSLVSELVKYVVLIPILFTSFQAFNILNLYSTQSALYAILIYTIIIILALIFVVLKGLHFNQLLSPKLLTKSKLIFGISGVIIPLIIIKVIDIIIVTIGII